MGCKRTKGWLGLAAAVALALMPPVHAQEGAQAPAEAGFPMQVPQLQLDEAGRSQHLGDAMAAAILAVLWRDLGEARPGELAIESVEAVRGDAGQWLVNGTAMALPGDGGDRVGLRFLSVFDPAHGTLSRPQLVFGGVAREERVIPNDPDVIRRLEDALLERLAGDFGANDASRLQLDRIETVQAGRSLLRVSANGLVDFGRAGSSRATVEALFDLRQNQWRQLDYTLAADSDWQPDDAGPAPVAATTAALRP